MADKKSFVLYIDSADDFFSLSDSQAGLLIKRIFEYELGRDVPTDDPIIEATFRPIKRQLDRDTEKWEKTRQRRAEAGAMGGKQKVANLANASKSKQKVANLADTVNVNVTDNVNVNVNDNVNDNVHRGPWIKVVD